VESHVSTLLRKLPVNGRAGLIALALSLAEDVEPSSS
jgi:DNA-binding CsgD family transcriptional regulator